MHTTCTRECHVSSGSELASHLPALLVPLHALCLRRFLDDPRHVSVLRNSPHFWHVLVPVLSGREGTKRPENVVEIISVRRVATRRTANHRQRTTVALGRVVEAKGCRKKQSATCNARRRRHRRGEWGAAVTSFRKIKTQHRASQTTADNDQQHQHHKTKKTNSWT